MNNIYKIEEAFEIFTTATPNKKFCAISVSWGQKKALPEFIYI